MWVDKRSKGRCKCFSPFLKNLEISAVFAYLIGDCCKWKGLVVGIGDVLVTDKSIVSGNKFWARGKILARVGG